METMGRILRDAVEAEVLTVAETAWGTGDPEPSASSSAFRIALEHPDNPTFWPVVGPKPAAPRVAAVEANADRELAAYVLARAGLRRTGADPRNVKFAYVVGLDDRLQRHLSRLWVGTTLGPARRPERLHRPGRRGAAEGLPRRPSRVVGPRGRGGRLPRRRPAARRRSQPLPRPGPLRDRLARPGAARRGPDARPRSAAPTTRPSPAQRRPHETAAKSSPSAPARAATPATSATSAAPSWSNASRRACPSLALSDRA